MKDIYTNARLTIVYLGEEADDSKLSMEYAESLSRKAKLEFVSEEDMATAIIQEKSIALATQPDEEIATALCHLFARPWFRRAWVVQEFAVAQVVTFVCGSSTCHWAAPYFAWSEVRQHRIDMESLVPGTVELAGMQNIAQLTAIHAALLHGFPQSFESLVTKTAHTLSTLPHDKLYSLLDLSEDAQKETSLQPRYDLPAETVYCAYASWMASTQEGCLRLLSSAQSADSKLELPTWVPDWTAAKYREVHEIKFRIREGVRVLQPERLWFDASAAFSSNSPLKPFIPYVKNRNTLVVRGMVRDVVFSCSPKYTGRS
jgi:hypothetical protein